MRRGLKWVGFESRRGETNDENIDPNIGLVKRSKVRSALYREYRIRESSYPHYTSHRCLMPHQSRTAFSTYGRLMLSNCNTDYITRTELLLSLPLTNKRNLYICIVHRPFDM
jgi:hypothetical protein